LPSDHVSPVILSGATAVGKSLVIEQLLEQGIRFEVINADAFQVYRGMDIGTAKPSLSFRQLVKHHGFDLLDPSESWSVGEFVRVTQEYIKDITKRGSVALISGGTVYYLKHLFLGSPEAPSADPVLREQLAQRYSSTSPEELHAILDQKDPLSAKRIHQNDRYRLLRALEVIELSGKPLSSFSMTPHNKTGQPMATFICLERPRDELRNRIKERVQTMFEAGLVAEVDSLKAAGYHADSPGMRAIGYREFFQDENITNIKQNIFIHTCQYAKRQETFFRSLPDIIRANPEDPALFKLFCPPA